MSPTLLGVGVLMCAACALTRCSKAPNAGELPRPPPPTAARPSAPAPEPSKEAVSLRSLGATLGTRAVELEEPSCTGCPGLTPFLSALRELGPGRQAGVVVLGNSLIASDGIVGTLRQRLVERFGDGGPGFLLADRIAPYGPRTRTGHARGRWESRTVGDLRPAAHPFGLAGVTHRARGPGAASAFGLNGEEKVELFWLDHPRAARLHARVDGVEVAALAPSGGNQVRRTELPLPSGARTLELVSDGPGVILHGIVLEGPGGGVVVDTFGVPSVDASLFLLADPEAYDAQLAARQPALIIVMLGGNEVKRLAWGRSDEAKIKRDLALLLHRVKAAAPRSACLVVGPIDSVRGPSAPRPFEERPQLATVNALQRTVALREGCAFFDLWKAMGGSGSIRRFHQRGLVHDDLVHPRGKGLDLLGQVLSDALLAAHQRGISAPSAISRQHP